MCPKCVRMCPEKGNVSGFNYNLKGNVSGIGKINVSEMCPEFSDFGCFSSEWAAPKWIIDTINALAGSTGLQFPSRIYIWSLSLTSAVCQALRMHFSAAIWVFGQVSVRTFVLQGGLRHGGPSRMSLVRPGACFCCGQDAWSLLHLHWLLVSKSDAAAQLGRQD